LLRNCLLKHVMEGNIEGRIKVTWRRGRRRKQLLNDLKGTKGYRELQEETLDRTVWRTRFGSNYGPVVRQNTVCINVISTDVCRMLQTHLHFTLARVKPRVDLSQTYVACSTDLSHRVLSVEILEQVCEDFKLWSCDITACGVFGMWHLVASQVLVNILREIPACDYSLDRNKLILQNYCNHRKRLQSLNWKRTIWTEEHPVLCSAYLSNSG